FTHDQDFFEANLARLKTPVRVVWGCEDTYIKKEMGIEFADRIHAEITLLKGIGHYPHLQAPQQTINEITAELASPTSFNSSSASLNGLNTTGTLSREAT